MEQSALCWKRESHTALVGAPVLQKGPGEEELVHLHTYLNSSAHQCSQVQIPAAWEEKYIIWLCVIQCTLHFPGRCDFLEVKLNNWQRPSPVFQRNVKKSQKLTCAAMRMCWEKPGGPLPVEHCGNQKTLWSMGSTHKKYRTGEIKPCFKPLLVFPKHWLPSDSFS